MKMNNADMHKIAGELTVERGMKNDNWTTYRTIDINKEVYIDIYTYEEEIYFIYTEVLCNFRNDIKHRKISKSIKLQGNISYDKITKILKEKGL